MSRLYPVDKQYALKKIQELDAKPFLTEEEQATYQKRVEIIEEYNRQFNRDAGAAYHLPTKFTGAHNG